MYKYFNAEITFNIFNMYICKEEFIKTLMHNVIISTINIRNNNIEKKQPVKTILK